MSLHTSLRVNTRATGAFRNVMKRHERVRHLMTQGTWTDGQSVWGLPKIKQEKIKARKAAPKESETAAAAKPATAAAPPAGG